MFSEEQLLTTISHLFWPFIRVSSLFLVLPVISSRYVPARIRLLLSVVVTASIAPVIKPIAFVDPISFAGLLMIAKQVLIGISMGFIFVMVLEAFIIGAQVIAMQSGLGFATLINPNGGGSVPLVSQFYLMLGSFLFIVLNGHLAVIEMLAQSFQTMPVDSPFDLTQLWRIVAFMGWTFQAAVYISLPIIISLLVINVAFAILTRAAPQLNIFAIGFPITLSLGLILVYINLSGYAYHFNIGLSKAFQLVATLSGG